MIDKILRPDPLAFMSSPEDAFIQRVSIFLEENNILDLSGNPDDDVELEAAKPDEKLLGPLTPYEKNCFVMASLVNSTLEGFIVDKQAGDYERIVAYMRERNVSFTHAANEIGSRSPIPPAEDRMFINAAAITHAHLMASYEWSVRQRYNSWLQRIIIRQGFVAYSYE